MQIFTAVRDGFRIDVANDTVVVPLHIVRLATGENICHGLDDIILDDRIGDVEHELITHPRRLLAGDTHGEFWMGTKEIAVLVDHLRLHPNTELQALFTDFCRERS